MRRPLALLALTVAAAFGTSLAAHAFVSSRGYQNADLRIREFKIPAGWEMVRQIGYPRIVVLASSSDGARLTFAVQRVATGASALTLAADARAALERQHFGEARISPESESRVRLDANFDGGRGVLRQEYILDGDLAYVLTLVGPQTRAARCEKEFGETLRSLVIAPFFVADGGAP